MTDLGLNGDGYGFGAIGHPLSLWMADKRNGDGGGAPAMTGDGYGFAGFAGRGDGYGDGDGNGYGGRFNGPNPGDTNNGEGATL